MKYNPKCLSDVAEDGIIIFDEDTNNTAAFLYQNCKNCTPEEVIEDLIKQLENENIDKLKMNT